MNKSFCLIILSFFIVSFNAMGQSVHLNYPANGYVTSNQDVEVCWTYIQGNSYEIEVSTTQNFTTIFYTATNLTVRKIVISNLQFDTKYYWRVRVISPTVSAWSYAYCFIQFNPNNLNSLSLWLRADSNVVLNGSNVLTWEDNSPNQYSVTQSILANQPTVIQTFCGNKSAIKFDGTDGFEIPFFNYGLSNSIFVVCKKNAGGTSGRFVGCYNNELEIAADLALASTSVLANYSTTSPSLLTLVRTATPSSFYFNDSLVGSTISNIPLLTTGGFYIGRSYSNSPLGYLQGEIAEILTSSSALNDSIIHIANRYLMDKYSEILTLGNDTIVTDNFCPINLTPNSGFNNFVWSTGETTSSIIVTSSGEYWLRAQDYFGRYTYDTIRVQFPIVNEVTSQPICFGSELIWNSGLSSNYTHQWQDNSSQNSITISNAGLYFLKVTDALGCVFYTDTAIISIDNFSIENTIGNDTNLCTGNTIQLNNNFSSGLSYLWSTGSSNDSISINNTGTYWVEVSNINNCILRDTINIVILGTAPNALFSAVNGCINTPVNFVDLSVPPLGETIAQWLWDFGDGVSSNLQNNVHIFDSAGVYNVSLKVVLQSGCGAIINQNITVFETPILNYSAFNLCNEKITEFNNTSNLFGGSLQSVSWNFGDPTSATNTANSNQAFHNFSAFGDYTLGLIIQTTEGCIDTAHWLINIKPSPTADFNSSKICLGDTTVFTDISSISFPWQNIHREWLFPDGDTSFAYQPVFNFSAAGNYQVSLSMQSSNGCRDTITKEITIYNKPIANLTYEKNCLGEATILSDSSSCNNCFITNYSWSIDNNYIGNAANVSYLFADTGSYLVTLLVANNAGCASVIDSILIINTTPVANFTINSNFGSPPFTAEFINLSAFATSYLWEFSDGSFSQNTNPSHTFNDTGVFNILLKAYNNDYCVSTYNQVLQLKPKNIDLVILELETNLVNGFIENTLVVFNKSTTIVTGFEALISNKANAVIKEFYDKSIHPGEFKTIKLNTKIKQGEGYNLSDVVCIELINIIEGLDSDTSNNNKCNTISTNEFNLLNLFPNPTLDDIYIRFICPLKNVISIEITDLTGKSVISLSLNASVGYNEYHIPTLGLEAGTYYCNVKYNGIIQSKSFIRLSK